MTLGSLRAAFVCISLLSRFPAQFAIRPSIRSNSIIKRDDLIKTIAEVVGPEHKVDLTNYDLMILVDVFRVSRRIPSGPIILVFKLIEITK